MNSRFWQISIVVTLAYGIFPVQAQAAEPVTSEDVNGLVEELSNWGRWGKEDQLGTLNLITPEKRVAAAALVTEGVSIFGRITPQVPQLSPAFRSQIKDFRCQVKLSTLI